MGGVRIEARELNKWFGQVIALSDLTFDAQAPIVGLLGPNGAGKSTLIKLLVGQLRPSKGEVRVLGMLPWGNRELTSLLGYCPEHDRFYEDLTVREFTTVLTRLHGFDAAEAARRAQEAIERVDLVAKADQPIRALSHGMRQRVKIAQALAHRPELLMLDEPLSGLDPLGRSRLIALFRALAQEGTGVLVSSHVLHELEAMTDEIVLLHRGRALAQGQVGRIRELIDRHPHRIRLEADRPRELGRELLRHEDVVRLEVDGTALVVETRTPDSFYERLGELAAEGEVEVRSMISLDDNLEAVFRYLVQG